MLKKILVCIWLALIGSGANAADVSNPPIELPFDPGKIGEEYSFDVDVTQRLTYLIGIRFHLVMPNKWPVFDREPTSQEARRFYELLGAPQNIAPGEWIELGVPAKFKVRIIQDQNTIFDDVINRPKTRAHSFGRTADLAHISLSAGRYTIRIEYLDGVPELAPLHAIILFARAHHGK